MLASIGLSITFLLLCTIPSTLRWHKFPERPIITLEETEPGSVPNDCYAHVALIGVCSPTVLRKFAEIDPGQAIAVILREPPGPYGVGYFAHAFSQQIGREGSVYAVNLPEEVNPEMEKLTGNEAHNSAIAEKNDNDGDIKKVVIPLSSIVTLPRLDLVWVGNGLSSIFDYVKSMDPLSFNAISKALKQNGLLIIMDEEKEMPCNGGVPSAPGSRRALGDFPHDGRSIDYDHAIAMIQKAGFRLESEDRHLPDPDHPHALARIYDDYGRTVDCWIAGYPFIWKFRKLSN